LLHHVGVLFNPLAVNIKVVFVIKLRELTAHLPAAQHYFSNYNKHTQIEQVTFRQPITQYHTLCWYPVSRPGLSNEQWPRVSFQMHKEQAGGYV
jgi:hypothetical protein